MKIKKLSQILGIFFIIIGFIFLLTFSMVVTGSSKEDFARDLFGFPIPHPPVWTSFIPYIGFILGYIFEFFSIHGLVGLVISGTLFIVGGFLIELSDKKSDSRSKQKETDEMLTRLNIPDVIKQEFIKRVK